MNIFNIILLSLSILCISTSFIIQIQRAKRYNNGVNNLRKAFMVNLFLFLVYLFKLLVDVTISQEPIYGLFNSVLLLAISLSVFLFYQENDFVFLTKSYWANLFKKKRV